MVSNGVLVVGGGIAGISSAVELAAKGFRVYLVEKTQALGGRAARYACKATDSCTQCGACLVQRKARELIGSGVVVYTNSEVVEVCGNRGDFNVTVRRKAQYVDAEKCTACGLCQEACEEKAIGLAYPGAVPRSYVVREEACKYFKGEACNACVGRCPVGAIDLSAKEQVLNLNVGAIVVATGFEIPDPKDKALLGYEKYDRVITGLDLENMLFEKGLGSLDGLRDIAFIQCFGSRDEQRGRGYCSRVCCKYALRLAGLIKFRYPDARITVYNMDIQLGGKGFAEVYDKVAGEVEFVSGIPTRVYGLEDGVEVRVEDFGQGKVVRRRHDLVVLSVGMAPNKDNPKLARVLGTNLGKYGFLGTVDEMEPLLTNREGVVLAGSCQGPKDITESMAHGIQAASRVAEWLST